jgi:DNA-binding MarR family transcriptional regulator
MSSVNEPYSASVVEQLGRALTVAKRAMEAQVAGQPVALRGSHLRLLSLTPVEGARPTDLAVRVGMTKQSLGEFVATLQQAGYLRVDPDPHDRRARIVAPTEEGVRLQKRTQEIFVELEERWQREVGVRNWAVFKKVLGQLAIDP